MDALDPTALSIHDSGCHTTGHSDLLHSGDLTHALAVAHVAHGMDPLSAGLQAQLDAPLLQPFLF